MEMCYNINRLDITSNTQAIICFIFSFIFLKCGGLQIHRNKRGANVSKY